MGKLIAPNGETASRHCCQGGGRFFTASVTAGGAAARNVETETGNPRARRLLFFVACPVTPSPARAIRPACSHACRPGGGASPRANGGGSRLPRTSPRIWPPSTRRPPFSPPRARVIADEVHHLDVCACVLDELDPRGRRDAIGSATSRRLDLTPRAPVGESALACTLVADYALGKPASAAAFAAARAVSREPLFAWAYTELLRDEARHATFGAKTAAWVIRRWSTGERRALWADALTASANAADRPHDHEAEALGPAPGELGLHAPALDPPAPRAARDPRHARSGERDPLRSLTSHAQVARPDRKSVSFVRIERSRSPPRSRRTKLFSGGAERACRRRFALRAAGKKPTCGGERQRERLRSTRT